MLPDWVSNPGHLTYESGALPIALRGPAPPYVFYREGRRFTFGDFKTFLSKIHEYHIEK